MSIFNGKGKLDLGEALKTTVDLASSIVPGGNVIEGVVKEVLEAATDGKDENPDNKDENPDDKRGPRGNRRENRRRRPK